jgi:transcription-repair coupling factor (superfamily II helicase)
MLSNKLIKTIKNSSQKLTLSSCLEGMEAMVLCDIVHNSKAVVHIAKDDYRARALIDSIGVFGNIGVIDFPAWDCLPFDRVSPNHDVLSRRAAALADMADYKKEEKPVLIVTTINSALQKMPNPHFMREHKKTLKVGSSVSIEKLSRFLVRNGFQRVGTVRESGVVVLLMFFHPVLVILFV